MCVCACLPVNVCVYTGTLKVVRCVYVYLCVWVYLCALRGWCGVVCLFVSVSIFVSLCVCAERMGLRLSSLD